MTRYGSDDVYGIFVDGYNLVSYVTEQQHTKRAVTEDVTVLGDTWRNHGDTGMREFDLSFSGFYDDTATSGIDARVQGNNGTAVVLCVLPDGNTQGNFFIGFEGPVQSSYDRTVEMGALHKAAITYSGSGKVEDGLIVAPHATRTSNGDTESTYVDGAAASALGAAGYIQVTAFTLHTATNLTVKLRHSADHSSWADLGTFTAITSGPTKQRLAVAAGANTPRRYLAASWTWTGGAGASSSATFFVGLHRIGAAQK